MSSSVLEDRDVLGEAVRRLVQALSPERIVAFGSRVRGEARADSDYDLLIVADTPLPYYKRAIAAHRALRGLRAAFDLIVHTPEEWEQALRSPYSFASAITAEGEVLYARG